MDDRYDKSDMGPFADMDPGLVEAITRYGTPPYRATVDEDLRDVDGYNFDELPSDIDGWIDWLNAARNEAPEEFRDDLACTLTFDAGYGDDWGRARLCVWYTRKETDAEMRRRVYRGVEWVLAKDEAERRAYEALKAKFETRQGS